MNTPEQHPVRVLIAAAEFYPLMKTGGLGDAVAALTASVAALGADLRVVIPGYGATRAHLGLTRPSAVTQLALEDGWSFEIARYQLADVATPIYLVNHPELFDRPGTPYTDDEGTDWPDNALRFGLFCKVTAALARGAGGLDWTPAVVHCHDWHTGLVPALLSTATGARPATVFNIHSAAYQGQYGRDSFDALRLPPELWSIDGIEYYGGWSFLKAGLMFADQLVTVSPTYAREILEPRFGCGLEGVLQARVDRLRGILNGVDYAIWNPTRDIFLSQHFDATDLDGKRAARRALQRELGLPEDDHAFIVAHLGRLTDQKGSDVLAAILPACLRDSRLQFAMLGRGAAAIEQALRVTATANPGRVGLHIGYSEALAHLLVAGADALLMPSRFEPCGLTQLYALAYGTVPIVHATGGLVDTVVDASTAALSAGTATGFVFNTLDDCAAAVARAARCFIETPEVWAGIVATGMHQSFDWDRSARRYLDVYRDALAQA